MSPKQGLKLTAISVPDATKALSAAAGRTIPEALLRADLGLGAPENADGSINLLHYAAWLVREIAEDRNES
jgi:hypothetical protein